MLEAYKERVLRANLELDIRGIVIYTWGNVSEIDREHGLVVIKPSGVKYSEMTADDMVVVDLRTGAVVEGDKRPSSDTPTHLALYRAFPEIGGITHTHSTCAVAFAQAGRDIPALGTTHADYFHGAVPCTRSLTEAEVRGAYEANTGKVIEETIRERKLPILSVPGVIVRNHGPFTWGTDAEQSVYHAVVLEQVAAMAAATLALNPESTLPDYVLEKHYSRKHGPGAYYGQR